jgi:hypothetical protein
MEASEQALFVAFLQLASIYVEFGCGGSTVLAASLVSKEIIALDSSRDWLDQVAAECIETKLPVQPKLVFADIGPTGEWGRPVDDGCKERWPSYSTAIWEEPLAGDADLYLVDGRFRVACFLETLLRCRSDSIILIHDFAVREEYHVVRQFGREIATTANLSAFVRRPAYKQDRLLETLEKARYHPG